MVDLIGKWVKLYNGIIMNVVKEIDADYVLCAFIPCSKNSKRYKIKKSDIVEVTDRETKRPAGCV
ncbi:MAG: hypothetical protein WC444_04370 [Candidatus Paceibacterota bacterium]